MGDMVIYDVFDISLIREYLIQNGEAVRFRRGECFYSRGDAARNIAVLKEGAFSFSQYDYKGREQILSMAFPGELIGAYIASQPGQRSMFDVRALCHSTAYCASLNECREYMDSCLPEGYRRHFAEAIAYGFLVRAVSFRCDSPEQRYYELLRREPHIHTMMTNTVIASYLGISREAFARLRAKNNNI